MANNLMKIISHFYFIKSLIVLNTLLLIIINKTNMKIFCSNKCLITVLLLICNVLFANSQTVNLEVDQEDSKPDIISVLIVDGFSNHQWDTNSEYLKIILETTNKFQVSVSSCPNQQESNFEWRNWNPNFNKYDVVIQTCNNVFKEDRLQWPSQVKKSFEKYRTGRRCVYVSWRHKCF